MKSTKRIQHPITTRSAPTLQREHTALVNCLFNSITIISVLIEFKIRLRVACLVYPCNKLQIGQHILVKRM